MEKEKFHIVKFRDGDWQRIVKAAKEAGLNPVEFVRTAANQNANVTLENRKRGRIKRAANASLAKI